MKRVAARGFTLIEVLVTVVIVAVMASVLVLSVGVGDQEQWLRRESERLQARIDYACERAELTGREIGMHLRLGGYAFSSLSGETWQFISNDKALMPAVLPEAVHLGLEAVELTESFIEKPQFLCLASGEATPMQLDLDGGAQATRWRIEVALDGRTRLLHRSVDDRDWREDARP